jgi:hypothetical protein
MAPQNERFFWAETLFSLDACHMQGPDMDAFVQWTTGEESDQFDVGLHGIIADDNAADQP